MPQLLLFHHYLADKASKFVYSDKQVSFITQLPLGDALKRVFDYQKEYKIYNDHLALEYSFLSVVEIPELPDELFIYPGMPRWIEKLEMFKD